MKKSEIQSGLMMIFDNLLRHFGPRHWWPAETTFEVIIGCILTQNVTWKNVEQAIDNLKSDNLINIDRLLKIEDDRLASLIKTTRYYNQKALNLKNFCRVIKYNFDNELENLFRLERSDLRKYLLSLKGIGKETADCIILYAANKPIFVVDAYTKRIFSRMGYFDSNTDYDEVQKFFSSNLVEDIYVFNEFHALIDALGHNICKAKNPLCNECPLNTNCKKLYL